MQLMHVSNMIKKGRMWMAYGSFFGGIRVVELNATTGYRKSQTDEGTLIASRPYSIDNGSLRDLLFDIMMVTIISLYLTITYLV